MQLTLLNVVQSYLNRTNDFFVEGIQETDVSLQVAQIAEEVFYSLCQKFRDWQYSTKLTTFNSVVDVTKPNYLTIPSNTQRVDTRTISYNNTDAARGITNRYLPVEYVSNEEFISRISKVSEKLSNTQIVEDFGGTKFNIENDKHPTYCTSFDGNYMVFNSFNQGEDTTLHEQKSRALMTQEVVFLQEDSFVIPIPEDMSELYRDLVIIECYEHILQQSAPPTMVRRAASRLAAAQQQQRKTGSMNRSKMSFGRN